MFCPKKEEKNIKPFSRNLRFFNFQFFFKMATVGRMIDFSKKFMYVKMPIRIWTLIAEKDLAEKLP